MVKEKEELFDLQVMYVASDCISLLSLLKRKKTT